MTIAIQRDWQDRTSYVEVASSLNDMVYFFVYIPLKNRPNKKGAQLSAFFVGIQAWV